MKNELTVVDLAFILECLKLSDRITKSVEKGKRLAPILEYSSVIQKKVNGQIKEALK